MKIIEALKELKTIDKRLVKQTQMIKKYASAVDGSPAFDSEHEQQKEVDGLIQSNKDLVLHRTNLRLRIYAANMRERVNTVMGNITIAEAIILRDAGISYLKNTYEALTQESGRAEFDRTARQGFDPENPPKVKRYYNESSKNDAIALYDEFLGQIDGILEVANAERELD